VTRATETRVFLDDIPRRRQPDVSIAVVGSPNAGKSTLFNRLTGLRQRIGNYPGVTVERHIGLLKVDDQIVELVDLPGTHGLSAHSMEEQIAVDVIFGRMAGTQPPDAILAVVDATNLYQGLFLVQQLIELELPIVIALTMTDAAHARGLNIDLEKLSAHLGGAQICRVIAPTGEGIAALRNALVELAQKAPPKSVSAWPELSAAAAELCATATVPVRRAEVERLLIDGATGTHVNVLEYLGEDAASNVEARREQLFGVEPPLAREARVRYAWVRGVLADVQEKVPALLSWKSRLTQFLNRPIPGTIGLFLVMAIVFQAVFAWATPMMDLIDGWTAALGSAVAGQLGSGWFSSLVADGVIAGVGSVIIFLPQILILFLFIILLEDSGYLARAAYLLDRVMRSVGLSGQSIIPMISSFACAVPGIMATRVIPNLRDRIATIHDLFGALASVCAANRCIRASAGCWFHEPARSGAVRLIHVRHRGGRAHCAAHSQNGLAWSEATVCVDAAGVSSSQYSYRHDAATGTGQGIPASRRYRHFRRSCHCMGTRLFPTRNRYTAILERERSCCHATRTKLARARWPCCRTCVRAVRLGLARIFRRHSWIPRARSRDRGSGDRLCGGGRC
jgi:ferrous iron transporter FeoB